MLFEYNINIKKHQNYNLKNKKMVDSWNIGITLVQHHR